MTAANEAGQQERLAAAELEVQLVGFKDRIRVAEHELAKQAPLLAQLNHSNQNMGNRVRRHVTPDVGVGAVRQSRSDFVLPHCPCQRPCANATQAALCL